MYPIIGVDSDEYLMLDVLNDIVREAIKWDLPKPLNPRIWYNPPGENRRVEVDSDQALMVMFEKFNRTNRFDVFVQDSEVESALHQLVNNMHDPHLNDPTHDLSLYWNPSILLPLHGVVDDQSPPSQAIVTQADEEVFMGEYFEDDEIDIDDEIDNEQDIINDDESYDESDDSDFIPDDDQISTDDEWYHTLDVVKETDFERNENEVSGDDGYDATKYDKGYNSDTGGEDVDPEWLKGKYFEYALDGKVQLEAGLMFTTKRQFLEVIKDYYIMGGFTVYFDKNAVGDILPGAKMAAKKLKICWMVRKG